MQKEFFILLGSLLLTAQNSGGGTAGSALSSTHIYRTDLVTKLEKTLCKEQKPPNLATLWNLDIYDAGIEGQFMTVRPNMTVPVDALNKASDIIATRNLHNGLGYGMCPQSMTGWVITAPAPSNAIKKSRTGDLTIYAATIKPYCTKINIDYAAAAGGSTRTLEVIQQNASTNEVNINLDLLQDGVLSVTCYPSYAEALGPELWYLVPVKGGPSTGLPHEDLLPPSDQNPATLLTWINRVRLDEKLQPLTLDDKQLLATVDKIQGENLTVHHDRPRITQVSAKIEKFGGVFIGENRVKGNNINQMAWLLWNSPRHRDLLLSKRASSVVLTLRSVKGEKLAVLTFAKLMASPNKQNSSK